MSFRKQVAVDAAHVHQANSTFLINKVQTYYSCIFDNTGRCVCILLMCNNILRLRENCRLTNIHTFLNDLSSSPASSITKYHRVIRVNIIVYYNQQNNTINTRPIRLFDFYKIKKFSGKFLWVFWDDSPKLFSLF